MKIRFNVSPVSGDSAAAGMQRPATRSVPRGRWYLLVALVLAGPLYLLLQFVLAYWWYTAAGFVTLDHVTIRPGSAGFLTTVVEEGRHVTRGEPLFSLSTDHPAEQPNRTASQREAAQAALALAEKQLHRHEQRLATMQQLMHEGAATRADVEAELTQLYKAESDVIRARVDVAARQLPARPDADVAQIERTAPFDGIVAQRLAHAGQWVTADTDVLVLQSPRSPTIMAYIDAKYGRYAQQGQPATLKLFNGETVRAKVIDVSLQASRLPAERVSPLSPRSQSIVVTLEPETPLQARYRIHMLPLDVRFDRW